MKKKIVFFNTPKCTPISEKVIEALKNKKSKA
jgi:hypothetical protein